MNFCPPKPGSTVMTRAMSSWLAQGASSSTVVPGLMAKPTYKKTHSVSLLPNMCLRFIIHVSHPAFVFATSFPHLHAALPDLLDEVPGVGGGLYVERVLVGSCCGHGLHPLLRPRHHHVHVCNMNTVSHNTAQQPAEAFKEVGETGFYSHSIWLGMGIGGGGGGFSHQRKGPGLHTSLGTPPWGVQMWCWVQSACKGKQKQDIYTSSCGETLSSCTNSW